MDAHGFGPAEELPPSTHNIGDTLMTGKDLELHIETEYAKVLKRAADLITAEARLPAIIESDEQDAQATQYVKQIQECVKELDRVRLLAKNPYDTCADYIHNKFRTFMDKLTRPTRTSPAQIKERVEAKQTAYKLELKRREDARREAEAQAARAAEQAALAEAARLQREAAEAAAAAARNRPPEVAAAVKGHADALAIEANTAVQSLQEATALRTQAERAVQAPAADMTRQRGGIGGVSSLKQQASFRNLDRATIDLEALRGHFTQTDIEKAVRSYLNANRANIETILKTGAAMPIAGVEFFFDYSTVTR